MKVKYLIVGAGVSGLSFASKVKDYLIIEKESEVGGLCRTIKQNGFIWDYAGHFFHFQNQEIRQMFLESIDENEIIYQEKHTKIYRKGSFVDYPFQKNIHQLPQKEFIDCLYDLYFREEHDHYNNFEEMLYGKFGRSITEMFLKPYNEKLYACNLNYLETDAMGRFFPYADFADIIRNMRQEQDSSYNSSFLYPRGGACTFIDVLMNRLEKDRVLLGCELLEIDSKNKIAVTSQGNIQYDYLINTMPLKGLCDILGTSCDFLSSNKVLVFNLGFDKKSKYKELHWLYIPDTQFNFYRVGFYDNILNQDRLSMYVELGFKEDAEVDIELELQRTLSGLEEIGITEGLKLTDHAVVMINPAYVHITENCEFQKVRIFDELKEQSIYTLGRYGKWTYCSIEDCVVDALHLAELLEKSR